MREMGGAEMLRKAVEKDLDAKEKNESRFVQWDNAPSWRSSPCNSNLKHC